MQASQARSEDHAGQNHDHGQGGMVQVELVFVYARHLDEHEPGSGERQDQEKPWVNPHLLPASRAADDKGEDYKDECQDPHNYQHGSVEAADQRLIAVRFGNQTRTDKVRTVVV